MQLTTTFLQMLSIVIASCSSDEEAKSGNYFLLLEKL